MATFEVGFVQGNVCIIAYKAVKTIFRTWWFCKKNDLPHAKWYGVYYQSQEIKIAEFGCLPAAPYNAKIFLEALNASPDKCSRGDLV